MANTQEAAPKEVVLQMTTTTPVNLNIQLAEGGALSLYLPNVTGDRNKAIKEVLQAVIAKL